MSKLTYRISYYALYAMFAIILIVIGLFFLGGDASGDALIPGVDPEMWQPAQTDALLYLMYVLFGLAIQKSMESTGFEGVPLSYQEARIYHWNQWADRVIGIENIPPELRVGQVMGDEWLMPNDPRIAEMNEVSAG